MGNGSSQSIVLGTSRYPQTESYPFRNGYGDQHRGIPKYVHPQNRVLPLPVSGQRLRSTDNGNILQTAGTIRGLKRNSPAQEELMDSEMVGAPRKRSDTIEKENDFYRHHMNMRNHRLFQSDPNIARRPPYNEYLPQEMERYGNRRNSGGGAANRTNKYKKKSPAPQPPPPGSSLPRHLERRSNYQEEARSRKHQACKCIAKNRAPQPPAIVVHPPPPPPLPNAVTTRTKIGSPDPLQSKRPLGSRSPTITRAVECCEPRTSYEKKVHPLEKWRNCRSVGDIRIDEEDEMGSRTTVFDSKKASEKQPRLQSYLPNNPDPFQKEIQAVTKKIAENRQEIENVSHPPPKENKGKFKENVPARDNNNAKPKEASSPPKFYFADIDVFKKLPSQKSNSNLHCHGSSQVNNSAVKRSDSKDFPASLSKERTAVDEVVPSLQRFSPNRRRLKSSNSPSRSSTPSVEDRVEKEWNNLSKSLYQKTEMNSDIDIRLRPVLPRKQTEVPKFSPSEAWQALGSDGFGSSNHSTSDDWPESTNAYKNGIHSRHISERSRKVPDLYKNDTDIFKHRSMSDSHWTPRQDLLDDSDLSSEGSDIAVAPRIRPASGEISTKFGLPTVMFSNMRPIGSDFVKSNQSSYVNGSAKAKQSKKKMAKKSEPFYENSTATSFKRLLSKRNRYLSEEDLVVSDSNWTFGQHGLQKRGKQYSSELILTDKKKHELNDNFSDFLEDILISKTNHLRKQMKSSDSGNSNFSFYSTEGVMYMPNQGGFAHEECSPPSKGRVYHMRRKFDPNIRAQKTSHMSNTKKISASDMDLGRRRDLELAKMIEDEVRKRRNKEKISIRQELHRMKNLRIDHSEEEFDDEAYFTEPKSREDSQSPLYSTHGGLQYSRHGLKTSNDSSRLSHWQSSPAIFEDAATGKDSHPLNKGHRSASTFLSSPSPDVCYQKNAEVDNWLQRYGRTKMEDSKRQPDAANDGDVSSSPTPAPTKKKEKRKTNIYKQLMDIVRKEEKHLRNSQKNGADPNSRESSYSQRESSPSTCSETSSISSYTYSDSSGSKNHGGKNGVSANKEFHSSNYKSSMVKTSAVPVALAQPYSPLKSYRPVAFDVATPYKMVQHEDGYPIQAGVS